MRNPQDPTEYEGVFRAPAILKLLVFAIQDGESAYIRWGQNTEESPLDRIFYEPECSIETDLKVPVTVPAGAV